MNRTQRHQVVLRERGQRRALRATGWVAVSATALATAFGVVLVENTSATAATQPATADQPAIAPQSDTTPQDGSNSATTPAISETPVETPAQAPVTAPRASSGRSHSRSGGS